MSLPSNLLEQLDAMTAERRNDSRSQTVADLIRRELEEHRARQTDPILAGAITLVYRTESGRVRHALAQTQLAYIKEVISSQHVFLEEDHSLEVLLVQGPAERLQQLCDDLRHIRSVEQITLVTTSSLLPPLHALGDDEAAETVAG
ncbi:MAG: CopG family ribbon-helix-helix protein [Caulobacteraceae bacterium]|nr:CopG family ribbon-helix-helix protein [Caulobacteraceae bacterium]